MSKRIGFSVVFECPQMLEIGSVVRWEEQYITVTSIKKVEYVSNRIIQVSGNGKKVENGNDIY